MRVRARGAHRWLRAASIIGGLVAVWSCTDRPPVAPRALAPGNARLEMAPSFQRVAPNGPVIRDSTVVGYLIGTNGDTVARGVATFTGDSAILVLEFPLTGSSADFTLDLTAFDASGHETHHGSSRVTLRQGDNSPPPPILVYSAPDSKIATLHVSPSSLPLNAGASAALGVSGTNANGQSIGDIHVGWVSRNPTIATVDAQSGNVQAGAFQGSTYIVASTYTGVLDSAAVSVRAPVDHITVNPPTATVARGNSVTVAADARDVGDNAITDRTITWSTSDPTVATVSSAGVVQGIKIGTATITASAEGKSGTSAITVVSPIDHIELSPSSLALASIGEKQTLSGHLVARSGSSVDGLSIAYSSSNAAVATVDANGQVTATGNGSATITASSDGLSNTASVTVQQVAAGIALSPKAASVPSIGGTAAFSAVVRDARGVPISNAAVVWTSSNADVASVSSTGLATARGNGSATITATINGKSDEGTFIVSQVPTRIGVSASNPALRVGETSTLTATTFDANNHEIETVPATWTTSTPQLVSINGNVATAVAGGTATMQGSAAGFTGTLTLRITGSPPSGTSVSGAVFSAATALPINGATITGPSGSATSGIDGTFSLSNVSQGSTLSISATGYVSTQYFDAAENGATTVGTIPLAPTSSQSGNFSGRVIDAVTGNGIVGAQLVARSGINATTGSTVLQVTTNSDGGYSASLPAGTYTISGSASGYIGASGTVVVIGGSTQTSQNIVATPVGSGNTIRIVLTWGQNPRDLDSHLILPVSGYAADYEDLENEVYYGTRRIQTSITDTTTLANLDQDVTSGHGPETITIPNEGPGTYSYFVHHFSGSSKISLSGTTVKVFRGATQIAQFTPSANAGCGTDDIWSVFTLNGGVLTTVNSISCGGGFNESAVQGPPRRSAAGAQADRIRAKVARHPKRR